MAMHPSVLKRQKELARRDRRQRKENRIEARRREAELRRSQRASGEDPDLAGIVPGPQPLPFE